ncbi:MAG TPA: CPBP family intramembrane glutamic endopeptidase [Rhizomicrobium sp.]|nr:CPBP family intramembrane glutamic endopeptidase [Rhizomicrobium sp.]
MTSDTAPAFRLKFLPILTVLLLGLGLPWIAAEIVDYARHYSHLVPGIADQLGWLYAQHGMQFVLALIAIAIVKRMVPADYGLHMPEDKSYVGWAVLWGLFFGVLMTAVDYAPNLIEHTAPKLGYPPTTGNVLGWLGFEGVYVGPTEEVLFRSLLATYLAATMPGKVRLGRYSMNGAGVVVAAIFALAHFGSFFDEAWEIALAQQFYAFALGVLYAYWLEKSRSILAPVVGHNVGDFVEQALLFLMVAYWAP